MRKAYQQSVEQITEFMYEGKVSGGADVFVICNQMGLKDVRGFIRTYLGKVQTRAEILEEKISDYLKTRVHPYPGVDLPSEVIIRTIFDNIMAEPPNLEKAAEMFTNYYKIDRVKLKFDQYLLTTLFYDFDDNTITVNPTRITHKLQKLEFMLIGLFEHLCDRNLWKFGNATLDESQKLQREETIEFVKRFASKCSDLGLLPPPNKD